MRAQRRRRGLAKVLAALLIVGLGLIAGVSAAADDLDDQRERTEAQQKATEDALAQLEGALEGTEQALADAYVELQGIQAVIPIAQQQLDEAEVLVVDLTAKAEIEAQRLEAAQALEQQIVDQIAENTERTEEVRAAIGQMAREVYRGGMTSSLSAVLDADSAEEFIAQSALSASAMRTQTSALRELEQLDGITRNQQARLEAVRDDLVEVKAAADAALAEAEDARQAAADRRAELDELLRQAEANAAYIESQRAAMIAQQADLEAAQSALENELAAIIAEQAQRAAENGTSPGLVGNGPLSYPVPPPVHVTSPYGMRLYPIFGYVRLHAGTDFRAYCGNPILAAADGTVQWATSRAGYGNQVLVNHGYLDDHAVMTSYNHLSSFAVSPGQAVARGQVIGYSGNTGSSTACHLHFEVYIDGATVDPMGYLG